MFDVGREYDMKINLKIIKRNEYSETTNPVVCHDRLEAFEKCLTSKILGKPNDHR